MPRYSLDKILSQYHLTLVLLTYCSRLAVLITSLVAETENSASLIPKPDIRHGPEPVHTPPSELISLVSQIHQFSVKLQVSTSLMPRPSTRRSTESFPSNLRSSDLLL